MMARTLCGPFDFQARLILTELPYNADQYSVINLHPRVILPLPRRRPHRAKARRALFCFAKDWFTLNAIA
jgi:hypothetical protein